MSTPKPSPTYYYAGGERVELVLDPTHVAVRSEAAATRSGGRPPSPQVVLLPADERPHDADAQLLPVYRSGSTLVVALAEVRVEDDDAAHLARLDAWLAEEPKRAEVIERLAVRVTLCAGPAFEGNGVALARAVVERCGVRSASPRLLRVTPRT